MIIMERLWQDLFISKHLGKMNKALEEFYTNLLAISELLKKLKVPLKSKDKKKFIKRLQRRTVFGPSIRSCLIKITGLKKDFDHEFKKLSGMTLLHTHLEVLFFKKRSAYGKLKGNYSVEEMRADQEIDQDNNLRVWLEKYYDLFYTDRSDHSIKIKEKIKVYVNDLIANLSFNGKFVAVAEKEQWNDIKIEKQEDEVKSLIAMIRNYRCDVQFLIEALIAKREEQ